MVDKRPRLIIISGPTGSGKSTLAVEMALHLGAQIISADSMQVYKGMDIGTAKLTLQQRRGVAHHLIDVIDPDEEFNASEFLSYALPAIRALHGKGVPIIVAGGTGLYLRTLLGGLFDCPPSDPELRKELTEECKRQGAHFLHQRLKEVDIDAAEKIDPNDRVRIVRALEVINLTGRPFSEVIEKHRFSDRRFNSLHLFLNVDRKILYERINRRVNAMIDSGLVEEVKGLLGRGYSEDLKPMRAIGYRHIVGYLKRKWGLDEAIRLTQRDTRRYAKRQIIWFRSESGVTRINPECREEVFKIAEKFVRPDYES